MEKAEPNILIAIPARYASTRLPGKPLIKIAGIEMIKRVANIAEGICRKFANCSYVVATDDERIVSFCNANGINATMTSDNCKSGTERCFEAANKQEEKPDFVLNFQGDAPLTPPNFLEKIIRSYLLDNSVEVVTPCENLTWDGYEKLKENKKVTPFSGTTAIVKIHSVNEIWEKDVFDAIWFSKTLIPSLRKTEKLKATNSTHTPVLRHIGLYGYTYKVLSEISAVPDSVYGSSMCEGLEQLKFIENGYNTKIVKVDYAGRAGMSGVDSPEDVSRAEKLIEEYGEITSL